MSANVTGGGPEVGVVVQDIDKMLGFYRDFLGLPVDQERAFPGVRLWWLKCGGSYVKLVKREDEPAAPEPVDVWSHTGLRYLTIRIDNVDEVASGVDSAGGEVVYRKETPDLTQAMMRDPEGNYVEVVHWY